MMDDFILNKEQAIKLPCNEVTLDGLLYLPKDACGLVLFAHGSGSSRFSSRNQFVAKALNGAGLATLLFDLLTKNEEAIDSQTGQFRFDIPLLAKRLVGTTEWCLKQLALGSLKIGYFGASTGGGAALVAEATQEKVIEAVVSRGGRVDLAGKFLSRVRAPSLLIVGELDEPVIEFNRGALEKLSCTKQLTIIPGASHLFEEPGTLEEVAALAKEWFLTYLQ